jgi:hypothetical protein
MSGILREGRPPAQVSGLITERVGAELVVYDGKSYEAHCLKPLACAVFEAVDGKRSAGDLTPLVSAALGESVGVSEIERALEELEASGLLVSSDGDGISRRGLIKRGAALGGVAVAASLVTTVATPAIGMAGSQPSGPPVSFSGLAILISCGSDTYSAKWDSSYTSDPSPSSWGVPGPNSSGSCDLPVQPTNTGTPSWSSEVTLTNAPNGFYITVPKGDVVTEATMFAGNITCGNTDSNKKCYTTATPTVFSSSSTTTTYYISIAADCYK